MMRWIAVLSCVALAFVSVYQIGQLHERETAIDRAIFHHAENEALRAKLAALESELAALESELQDCRADHQALAAVYGEPNLNGELGGHAAAEHE